MQNKEAVRKYELVVILDAQSPQTEREGIIKDVSDLVIKSGAKVINSTVWLEKQKFTFSIKKKNEGTYYLINVEGAGQAVEKIKAVLRLDERLLRYAVVVKDAPSVAAKV